jgi:hypothetical protein
MPVTGGSRAERCERCLRFIEAPKLRQNDHAIDLSAAEPRCLPQARLCLFERFLKSLVSP